MCNPHTPIPFFDTPAVHYSLYEMFISATWGPLNDYKRPRCVRQTNQHGGRPRHILVVIETCRLIQCDPQILETIQ